MRKTTIACFAMIVLAVAPANAQSKGTAQQQAHAVRKVEIRRQNYAKQEAVRLLLGPQGLLALRRPSDPQGQCTLKCYYQRTLGDCFSRATAISGFYSNVVRMLDAQC
jgi:hypothetical protein